MDSDQYTRPPGTYYDIVAHPSGEDAAIEIAIVQDHRFAFFYWMKWMNNSDSPNPPTLISLDWHQDLAAPCDVECEWLVGLDRNDYKEISFFCWDKLHCHNDGHILAAAYLNIIGDIHVVQKQDEYSENSFQDHYGNMHRIFCYTTIDQLLESLSREDHESVIFDIDLDYFTESQDSCGGGSDVKLVSADDIAQILRPDGMLMSWIFPRLNGMSIATEPEFCGGLSNSNRIFDCVNASLFNPGLLSDNTTWKYLAFAQG